MRILAEVEYDEVNDLVSGHPYQIITRNTTLQKVQKLFEQHHQLRAEAKKRAEDNAVNQSVNLVNDEIDKALFLKIKEWGFMHKSELNPWFDYKATEIVERERQRVWWNKLINPVKAKFKAALLKLGLKGIKSFINR